MRSLLTLLLLIFFTLPVLATTFTVTTNADSGPGSLRDAITQANANGTTTPDIIIFNIADQTRAGRTIMLASALPDLSSNLTIDGTTQPGNPFGISAARVIITNPYALAYVYYFTMVQVQNVSIYGLFLQGVSAGYGFYFRESDNLIFGAPGKGNIIQGFGVAIESDHILGTDPGSHNVTIQSNIMGTDESGASIGFNQLNLNSISVLNTYNLQIGGLNPGEGNLMNQNSFPFQYTDTYNDNFGFLNFQGNLVGVDITGNIRLSPNYTAVYIDGYNDGVAEPNGTTVININITNNVSAGGYSLFKIASPFLIQGNHIGVGLDNSTNLINGVGYGQLFLIYIISCGHGLIGGPNPNQKNYIAYDEAGVYEFICGPITIQQNSFFCNGIGIARDVQTPTVNITILTPGTVGGTTVPNAIVELFYDDACPGCEGKTYIGTTTADASGSWIYSVTATGAIVATATDPNGATSEFSKATINTNNIVVQDATCGRSNGSIKNIEVTSGTEWYWKDAAGTTVATSKDLTNVAPGTYTFVTSIGGAACDAASTPYTIKNVNLPAFDPADITITQPTCGQNSGAFAYTQTFDPATNYSWSNTTTGASASADFSTANPLNNLAPGSYTLTLALKQDATCSANYGPFVLTNQAGPSLVTGALQINPSTCAAATGSITGMSYQNATGTVYTAWRDANGGLFSTSLDLINALPNDYRFEFKDGGSCDTIFSAWYTIPDQGTITYDLGQLTMIGSSCIGPTGSITGIKSLNATIFTWTNVDNGTVVGTNPDLWNVVGGNYQLTMSNAFGCQATTEIYNLPQVPSPMIDYTNLQSKNDTCNAGTGSISGLNMQNQAAAYTWNWYNSQDLNTPIATSPTALTNLKAGTYIVIVSDQYTCTATSRPLTITDLELSPPIPQVQDQAIPRNTSTIIQVGNLQKGSYSLLDGPGPNANIIDQSPTGTLHTPNLPQDATFYVGFTRGDCISTLATVRIKVFDSVQIFVPNAFTPNGDGSNDRWHIVIRGLTKKIQISVFDRYGAQVVSSNSPDFSWDGTAGGQQRSGTFVYMIAGTDFYNKPFFLKGTVTIVR